MASLLDGFSDKLKMDAKTLWQEHKLFFIIFGVLIVVIKFRNVLIDLLVSNSKWIFENAQKESDKLLNQEKEANSEADELVKHSEKLGKDKPGVSSDWYKHEE